MLFYSPFFNNHAGTICTGSATLPKHVSPDHMNDWEDVFFNSGFTLEGPPRLKGIKGEVLWKNLINKGKRRFPERYLVTYRPLKNLFNL